MNVHELDSASVVNMDLQEAMDIRSLKEQGRGPRWAPFPSVRLPGPRPFHSAFGDDVVLMQE